MKVFRGFDEVQSIRRPIVTIGSYDGVHRGHREIIAFLNQEAREWNGESTLITFDPHPRTILYPDEPLFLLNSLEEKLSLLEEADVQNVIVIPFDKAFSRIPAKTFVSEYLVAKLNMNTLVVGYNHHLGHNKAGDPDSLRELAYRLNFRLVKMPKHEISGHKVSSTVIRNMIATGQVSEAAEFLGHPYPLTGILENGVLLVPPLKLLPPPGTYQITCTHEATETHTAHIMIDQNRAIRIEGKDLPNCSKLFHIEFA